MRIGLRWVRPHGDTPGDAREQSSVLGSQAGALTSLIRATIREALDDDPEMLTLNEIAALMKVNPRTVKKWIDSGKLARLDPEMTTRVLVRKAAVLEFQRSREVRMAG